jgi:hypothetical protein
MRPLSLAQRLKYFRGAGMHALLTRRDRFFIHHWALMNKLATQVRLPLPQFMYNTSLTTFAAMNAYRPQPVPIRLTLIRASDTREIPGASVACGWEKVAMHGVDVLWAPGDHETMFLDRNMESTTALVRRCLAQGNRQGTPEPVAQSALPPGSRLLHVGSV